MPCSPSRNGLERQRVSDDDFSESGNMLVSRRTIGVNDAHVFYQTIKINYAIRRTPENPGQALVERLLFNSFILQPFPAAAVKDVDMRHIESDAIR